MSLSFLYMLNPESPSSPIARIQFCCRFCWNSTRKTLFSFCWKCWISATPCSHLQMQESVQDTPAEHITKIREGTTGPAFPAMWIFRFAITHFLISSGSFQYFSSALNCFHGFRPHKISCGLLFHNYIIIRLKKVWKSIIFIYKRIKTYQES